MKVRDNRSSAVQVLIEHQSITTIININSTSTNATRNIHDNRRQGMTGMWQGIIDCYNGECRDWGQDSQRLTVLIRWPLSTDRPSPSTHRQRHDGSHRQPVSNVMMSFSRLAIGLFLSLYCLGDVMREARSFPLSFVSTQLTTWYHDRTCHDIVTEFVCLLWILLIVEVWCLLAYLIACEQLHHH